MSVVYESDEGRPDPPSCLRHALHLVVEAFAQHGAQLDAAEDRVREAPASDEVWTLEALGEWQQGKEQGSAITQKHWGRDQPTHVACEMSRMRWMYPYGSWHCRCACERLMACRASQRFLKMVEYRPLSQLVGEKAPATPAHARTRVVPSRPVRRGREPSCAAWRCPRHEQAPRASVTSRRRVQAP